MTLYLESSALLRYLFGADGAREVQALLSKAKRIVSSRLLKLEVERALLRVELDKETSFSARSVRAALPQIWARIDFLEITRDVCERAGSLKPESRLRSLDAIHLASYALLIEIDSRARMVSYDQRILSALSG